MYDARDFTEQETLRDGTRVTIRAVRPDDRGRVASAFRNLESASVYTRFFSHKRELSDADLGQIEAMDFVDDVMLVVTMPAPAGESIIASARFVAGDVAGVRAAEVSFTVEEDYQGRGIAGRLLSHLAGIALRHGIRRFDAEVLAGNRAMLAVFARTGWPMSTRRDGGVVHVELALPWPGSITP